MSKCSEITAHAAVENTLKGVCHSVNTETTLSKDFCNRVFTFSVAKNEETFDFIAEPHGDTADPVFEISLADTYHNQTASIRLNADEVVTVISMLNQIIS